MNSTLNEVTEGPSPDEDDVTFMTRPASVPLSREAMLAIAVYLTVVGLTSTVGNSIFVTVLRHRLKTISDGQTVLLLNSALCDLGISITGYPYTTVSSYVGRWIFGDVMCQMYGFLCFTLNQVQMNTLVIIAIFRYISICHPQFKHLLKPGLAKQCLVAAWLYGVAWSTPPLLGWSRYVKEPFEASCSTDWYDRSPSGIAYSICLVVFCYLVHVTCLAICYQKILYKSRQLQLSLPETNPKLSLYGVDDVNISEASGVVNITSAQVRATSKTAWRNEFCS
ncbi:opsin-5-like [Penaeus japonicus]|uniref:opsin-5-like n=1 Tax=Penaeus japonicus TaxID=27405 RepID=UPI001C7120C7|nr:opsin-5-like [Penaeus japonicus]